MEGLVSIKGVSKLQGHLVCGMGCWGDSGMGGWRGRIEAWNRRMREEGTGFV